MRETIEQAINFCIEALNHDGVGSDQEVLSIIRSLENLPYQGTGLGIGTGGYRGYRSSYEDLLKRFINRKTITGSLSWEDALLLLYDAANFDEKSIFSTSCSVKDDIIFNHILEHILNNLVAKNDIESALKFIPNFRTTTIFEKENNHDRGYLIVLRYYSSKGEPTQFFNYFKLAEPRKNKSEVADLKAYLVESFAGNNPIEKTLELCSHKNLGEKMQQGH